MGATGPIGPVLSANRHHQRIGWSICLIPASRTRSRTVTHTFSSQAVVLQEQNEGKDIREGFQAVTVIIIESQFAQSEKRITKWALILLLIPSWGEEINKNEDGHKSRQVINPFLSRAWCEIIGSGDQIQTFSLSSVWKQNSGDKQSNDLLI